MYIVEGFLKVMFFPGIMLAILPGYSLYLNLFSLGICILAILRMVGRIQLNKEYAGRLMTNEFFANCFYILSQLGGKGTLVYQMPLILHFLVGACEFWARIMMEESGFMFRMAQYVRQNRYTLILTKQKIEIYLFVYSIFGIFIGTSNIFQVILLFQCIAMKSKVNQNMISAQYSVKMSYTNTLVNNAWLPAPLRKAFEVLWRGYEKILGVF